MMSKNNFMLSASVAALLFGTSGAFAQDNVESMPVPRAESTSASSGDGSTAGDNLGNHTATEDLGMGLNNINLSNGSVNITGTGGVNLNSGSIRIGSGGRIVFSSGNGGITGLSAPQGATDAVNKAYVDSVGASSGDNLGSHNANTRLDMGNNKVINLAAPTAGSDAATKFYVDTSVSMSGDNLGNHIATRLLNMSNFRITSVSSPVDDGDVTNKAYVDNAVTTVRAELTDLTGRRINAGTGLIGGGDLTADRTLAFDLTFGDGRYALKTLNIATGTGLTGGGSLSTNRTLSVDGTVVRTTGNQLIGGNKTLTSDLNMSGQNINNVGTPVAGGDAVNKTYVDAAIASVPGDNLGNHNATTRLNLSGNKVISMGLPTVASDGANKQYVDAAVAAVPADNLGNHAATQSLNMVNNPIINLPAPTAGTNAANKAYVDTAVAGVSGDNLGSHNATIRLNMTNQKIVGLGVPTANTDAATKGYVDSVVSSAAAGDDLGNHNATTRLNMGGNNIASVGAILDTSGRTIRDANGGWMRTYGNSGWYSQTHGGGWFMQDTTWIRAYNNKNVVTGGLMQAATFNATSTSGGGFQGIATDSPTVPSFTWTGDTNTGMYRAGEGTIGFATNSGQRMRIEPAGVVVSGTSTANTFNATSASGGGFQGIDGDSSTRPSFTWTSDLDTGIWKSAANQLSITTGGSNEVNINNNGITVVNDVTANRFYGNTYFYRSDERMKHDIETITRPMDDLNKVRAVSYKWNDTNKVSLGVIAQEVEKVYPEMVGQTEDGFKSVEYIQLIAPMLAAVQELDARVTALEAAQ